MNIQPFAPTAPHRLGRVYAALCLFVLAACGGAPKEVIRIGVELFPGTDFVYLAQQKGYFEDEGVRVEIVDFSSLGDTLRAYDKGQIDIATGTLIELLLSHEHGERTPQAFFGCDFSNGADCIIAKHEIADVAGLKGKRVAVEPATVNMLILSAALRSAGLTLADVELVNVPQIQMPELFARGEVDALATYPPSSIQVMNAGTAHLIFDSGQIPGIITDTLFAEASMIREREEDLAGIVRAVDRAVRYLDENRADAVGIMSRREGITPAEFEEALTGLKIHTLAAQAELFAPDGSIVQAVRVTEETLRAAGLFTRSVPLDALLTSRVWTQALKP
jgi:NitT/TauT family transport system substrate-binding protein